MENNIDPYFARPNYTGYAFFIEHVYKGGILRLKYANGTVLEKAELAYDGNWYTYNNFGGLRPDDFWYDSAEKIEDEDAETLINKRENLQIQHDDHIDVYEESISHTFI